MRACPCCEGVLACAEGCDGPNAAGRLALGRFRFDWQAGASVCSRDAYTPGQKATLLALARAEPTAPAGKLGRLVGVPVRAASRWLKAAGLERPRGRPRSVTEEHRKETRRRASAAHRERKRKGETRA
jgi:hypothetical protein